MKRFASQYVFTNSGPPLKRAVITTEDDGEIINIENTSGDLKERHSIEFYNGIIVPGFVNCHCHLELSHMKGFIKEGTGLGEFIEQVRTTRKANTQSILSSAYSADNYMFNNGIVLCADICNTSDSFTIKKDSRIRYVNLLEVFGLDPDKAVKRIDEITVIAEKAKEMDLTFSMVPHSAYSLSLTLFRLLRDKSLNNKVTSIHFMETAGEEKFLKNRTGTLMNSYERSGLLPARLETPDCHASVILEEVTKSGNLILVHNTFADRKTVRQVNERVNLFWCLCPNSNIYIENRIPPVEYAYSGKVVNWLSEPIVLLQILNSASWKSLKHFRLISLKHPSMILFCGLQ